MHDQILKSQLIDVATEEGLKKTKEKTQSWRKRRPSVQCSRRANFSSEDERKSSFCLEKKTYFGPSFFLKKKKKVFLVPLFEEGGKEPFTHTHTHTRTHKDLLPSFCFFLLLLEEGGREPFFFKKKGIEERVFSLPSSRRRGKKKDSFLPSSRRRGSRKTYCFPSFFIPLLCCSLLLQAYRIPPNTTSTEYASSFLVASFVATTRPEAYSVHVWGNSVWVQR